MFLSMYFQRKPFWKKLYMSTNRKLLGIIMMPPENASEKWPLSIYFQNSCDQDYPFFEWKEGNIPFFANAAAKAENYTAEEIRAKFDYEIEDENLEYYRRNTCYNDIFEALALEPWLYNHCTDVPFVTFALQGIQNEAERYRYCLLYTSRSDAQPHL